MRRNNPFYKIAYLKTFWDFRKNQYYFYDFDGNKIYFDNDRWSWDNRHRYWFKFLDNGKKIVDRENEHIMHLI